MFIRNIILIGLPGAGKSTIGVILAKTFGMNFVDTDILIQEQTGRLLQELIDSMGPDTFLSIEEETILTLDASNAVIATGGSAVFSRRAMEHLKSDGIVLYLKIPFEGMVRRLNNITTRGIVLYGGQSLRDMYNQRIPLYEKYADRTIDCSDENFERIVEKVIEEINKKISRY